MTNRMITRERVVCVSLRVPRDQGIRSLEFPPAFSSVACIPTRAYTRLDPLDLSLFRLSKFKMPGTRPTDEEIAKMSVAEKIALNIEISARNERRKLYAQWKGKGINVPSEDGDGFSYTSINESLVEISIPANPTDPNTNPSAIEGISPEQTLEFLKMMQFTEFANQVNRFKRPISPSNETDPAVTIAKKFRRPTQTPVKLTLGQATELAPPQEIDFLYHSGAHVSMALFLPANVRLLTTGVANFTTGKANMWDQTNGSFKTLKVINAADPRLQQEYSLTLAEWMSCCGPFLSWAEKVDPENAHFLSFQKDHIAFVTEKATDPLFDWDYVRDFDICERRDYSSRPFFFDSTIQWSKFHVSHLQNYQSRKALTSGANFSSCSDRNDRSGTNGPGPGSGYSTGANSAFRGKDSFRGRGNQGDFGDRQTNCLICGRTNHRMRDCTAKVTAHNKPVACSLKDGRLVVTASGNPVCATWNAYGKSGVKCKDHNRAEHVCSLCGKPDHTSLACQ